MVIWVLVFLIALGTEFAFSMRTEVNSTRNHKEDIETYYLAKSGIHLAMAEILQKASYHSRTEEKGYQIGKPRKNDPEPGRESDEEETEPVNRKDIPLGQGTVTYTLNDENGKININTASRAMIVKALEVNGLPLGSERDRIADSILDWIDKDDNHRVNGAESEYYEGLTPPYPAKNGPLDSIDEMLRIRGITKELLYGSDDYVDGEDNSEGIIPGLERIFTIHSVPMFNPNTADKVVLSLIYTEAQVDEILEAKEDKGYYNQTLSTHFRIEATGQLDNSDTEHTVIAVIEKQGTDEKAKLLIRFWKDNVILG